MSRIASLSLLVILAVGFTTLEGADYVWNGSTSGLWTEKNNWTPNSAAPGNKDRAIFNATSTGATTLTGVVSVGHILFDTGAAAFTLTLTGTSFVPDLSPASITMTSGVTNSQSFIGTTAFAQTSGRNYSFVNDSSTSTAIMTFGSSLTFRSTTSAGVGNTLNLGGSNTGANEYAGNFNNGGSSSILTINKIGVGNWIRSGAGSYSGATNIQAGTLTITNNGALGTTVGGTIVSDGAALQLSGNRTIGAEALTLNGAGLAAVPAGALRSISGTSSYGGLITLGSASTIQADADTLSITGGLNNGGFLLTLGGAGNISFTTTPVTGAGGLTKKDAGILTLTAESTYSGPTTISDGTVRIGVASPGVGLGGGLGLGSDVEIANLASAALDLTNNGGGNFNTRIGSLTGGGALGGNINLGSATLTIHGSTSPAAYSGVISGTGGKLVYSGTGTLTLGRASLYTGGTTVSGGILGLGAADVLPDVGTVLLSGGSLSTGTGFSDILGPLAVNSTGSKIVLGAASHTLTFASVEEPGFTSLTIDGWTGSASGGANGKIVFNDVSAFTSTILGSIDFTGFGTGAALIAGNQLVPLSVTPEPVSSMGFAVTGLLLGAAWRRRNRSLASLSV